jgi:hypothetical protein
MMPRSQEFDVEEYSGAIYDVQEELEGFAMIADMIGDAQAEMRNVLTEVGGYTEDWAGTVGRVGEANAALAERWADVSSSTTRQVADLSAEQASAFRDAHEALRQVSGAAEAGRAGRLEMLSRAGVRGEAGDWYWSGAQSAWVNRETGEVSAGEPDAVVNVPLTTWEARRMAMAILVHLDAWEVITFQARVLAQNP